MISVKEFENAVKNKEEADAVIKQYYEEQYPVINDTAVLQECDWNNEGMERYRGNLFVRILVHELSSICNGFVVVEQQVWSKKNGKDMMKSNEEWLNISIIDMFRNEIQDFKLYLNPDKIEYITSNRHSSFSELQYYYITDYTDFINYIRTSIKNKIKYRLLQWLKNPDQAKKIPKSILKKLEVKLPQYDLSFITEDLLKKVLDKAEIIYNNTSFKSQKKKIEFNFKVDGGRYKDEDGHIIIYNHGDFEVWLGELYEGGEGEYQIVKQLSKLNLNAPNDWKELIEQDEE